MDGRHKQKIYNRPFIKLLKIPIAAMLVFLAVMAGIQAGDILYRLDVNLVEKIDSENFKNTINLSLPIIETVYNSGKSSVSFLGEVKELFNKIFEFDLDSPMTILNVQSPLFMSYYNHEYKSRMALDHGTQQPQGQQTPGGGENSNGTGAGTGKGAGSTNTGTESNGKDAEKGGEGTGNTDIGTDDSGSGSGKGAGGTGGAGKSSETGEGSNGSDQQNNDAGGQSANPGDSINTPGKTSMPQSNSSGDLQPISSISYETEDEDEEDDDSDLVALDKVVVRNFTKHKIDIAALLREPLNLKFSKKGPKVLIYHTHTSESYVLKEQDLGKKGVASFNSNPKYNVVRVGEELARYLKKYGVETLHNATVHDKNRPAAYGVAINTLQSYMKSYPSIKVYIDIHRDGLEASKPKLRVVKKINGKNAAQIMFVMGTNDQLPNPHWEENLKFALKVQQKLNEKYPGLARPVWIVGKRYNQQVSNQAVLIEVGGDGNLLSECLESTKYLADALNEVMKEK